MYKIIGEISQSSSYFGGRVADPGGRVADPGGRVADPGDSVSDQG